MPLPSSGVLSMADIAAEFGGAAPHALSDYYGAGGAPAGPQISIGDFYGRSAYAGPSFVYRGSQVAGISGSSSTWSVPAFAHGGDRFIVMMALISDTSGFTGFGNTQSNFSDSSTIGGALKAIGTSPWREIWYIKGGLCYTPSVTASTTWSTNFPNRVHVSLWEVVDYGTPNHFPFFYRSSSGPMTGQLKYSIYTPIEATGYIGMVHTNAPVTTITGPNASIDLLNQTNNRDGYITTFQGFANNPTEGAINISVNGGASPSFPLVAAYGYGLDPRP